MLAAGGTRRETDEGPLHAGNAPQSVFYGPHDVWSTFKDALAAYEAAEPPYSGIGFVFSSGDPYTGIDLDDCRNPETGAIAPWAQRIIDRVQEGYIETSPSRTGVHIIVEGTVRDGGLRKGPIEMYSRERFFTITGEVL